VGAPAAQNTQKQTMAKLKNAMELFSRLDKSNCRVCGEKTCLAFAGAVYRGVRRIDDCPKLPVEILDRYREQARHPERIEQNRDEHLERLRREIRASDLAQAAFRTGGVFSAHKLTVKILGKDFSVDTSGKFSADIHVNPWVAAPFLNYVLHGKGLEPLGRWVSFRELRQGRERYALFEKRCEGAMKQVADRYPALFDDLVHLFGGQRVAEQFASDISVVLLPLPKVPLMICYWLPEEGIQSSLNLFFDDTADENLDIGSLFSLGSGLAQMFEKLAIRHGF
jgi:hypothetical protein